MDPLAQFYRRHAEFVWRARRIARVPAADIADLAHDVFLIIGRKLPTYAPPRGGASPEDQERAWIYKIASYEAKNHRAKSASRNQVPMDSADEIPDERNDSARVAEQEYLLLLLDSLTPERRRVFALIEVEGFTAPEAARMLNLGESNVNRLLRLAREDVRAEAARLERSAPVGQPRRSGTLLLPFGVGAWTKLRDALNPSANTTARVWQRLEATIAHLGDESDGPPDSSPSPPPRRGRVKSLRRYLRSALGHLLSAVLGGAIVAWLLLSRPTASIAVLRIPVPFLIATTPTSLPGPLSTSIEAPDSASATTTPSTTPSAGTPLNSEELRLLRQAHIALTAGNVEEATAVLKAYDAQFPEGHLRNDAQSLWSRVRRQAGRPAKPHNVRAF